VSYSTTLNFPVSGNYTFNISVDNYGLISIDGTDVLDNPSSWGGVDSASVYVSAGSHTITVTGTNYGGPGGISAQIINPSGAELWNTLHALNTGTNYNGGPISASGGSGYVSFSW
jgi:hypothetical protein